MNLLATRSAVVAAVLGLAQACTNSNSETAQGSQTAEVLAQDELAQENQGELAQDNEVGARDKETPSAGLGVNSKDPSSEQLSAETAMHLRQNCPMAADEVEVETGLTSTGTMLRFTTESGDVADLRRRVRHMGEIYGTYDGEVEMNWYRLPDSNRRSGDSAQDEGGEEITTSTPGPMPPVNVAVVNLDKGAQIVLTPTEEADLETIRYHTTAHHKHLDAGQCWMPESPLPGASAPATPMEEVGGL